MPQPRWPVSLDSQHKLKDKLLAEVSVYLKSLQLKKGGAVLKVRWPSAPWDRAPLFWPNNTTKQVFEWLATSDSHRLNDTTLIAQPRPTYFTIQ